jgi:hypothetical protein
VATMLSVYATWIEGSSEADIAAIQEAMNTTRRRRSGRAVPGTQTPQLVRRRQAAHLTNRSRPAAPPTSAIDQSATGPARDRFDSRLGTGPEQPPSNYLKAKENSWRRGWDSNERV